MNKLKKYLKLIIGIAVLILVLAVFFLRQKSSDLENGNLAAWARASDSRRLAAAEMMTGGEHSELVAGCLDKMARLSGSEKMKIRDAASLCLTGIMMKDKI